MGNELTEQAAATLDFRDVVRNLEWREKWPLGEGLAFELEVGGRLGECGAMLAGKIVSLNEGFVYFDFRGPATLREVLERGRLVGGAMVERGSSRRAVYSEELVADTVPGNFPKL